MNIVEILKEHGTSHFDKIADITGGEFISLQNKLNNLVETNKINRSEKDGRTFYSINEEKFITFTPTTKDSINIADSLDINAEQFEDHGDIIDYNTIVPFNDIPVSVKEDIEERYAYSEMTDEELEDFKDDLICRANLSIGIDEDRGFEVHCSSHYFYTLNSGEEPHYTDAQGAFNRKWLKEVYDHLELLGWTPVIHNLKKKSYRMINELSQQEKNKALLKFVQTAEGIEHDISHTTLIEYTDIALKNNFLFDDKGECIRYSK